MPVQCKITPSIASANLHGDNYMCKTAQSVFMDKRFGDALIWHVDRNETNLTDLSRHTGVSLSVIKNLNTGRSKTVPAEAALAIAAYYGKSLPAFLRCEDGQHDLNFEALLDLLTDQERKVLHHQIRAMLSTREE